MEKFRIYENIPKENVTSPVYLINKETDEKIKLPHIKGFYVIFKTVSYGFGSLSVFLLHEYRTVLYCCLLPAALLSLLLCLSFALSQRSNILLKKRERRERGDVYWV